MPRIGIVTDSTADIPPDIAAELDITVIPCHVHFGKVTYRDGVDLTHQELYARLAQAPPFPTTSQPPVGVFVETYRHLAEKVDHIISIHLASNLSALYNVARLASEMTPEIDITLIDSRQISMCTGWLAIAAAKAARDGRELSEIVGMVKDMVPRLRLLASVRDLQYLHRSGRVGWTSAMLGTILQIRPLVLVKDGSVALLEKARTESKSLSRLVELVLSYSPLQEITVLHANAPQAATEVAERLSVALPDYPLMIVEAGVTVGSHAGPGAVGVACLLAEKDDQNRRSN